MRLSLLLGFLRIPHPLLVLIFLGVLMFPFLFVLLLSLGVSCPGDALLLRRHGEVWICSSRPMRLGRLFGLFVLSARSNGYSRYLPPQSPDILRWSFPIDSISIFDSPLFSRSWIPGWLLRRSVLVDVVLVRQVLLFVGFFLPLSGTCRYPILGIVLF